MILLTDMFGGDFNFQASECNDKEYICKLYEFAQRWDYRKKQAQGGERWNIFNEPLIQKNEKTILEAAKELGLVNVTNVTKEPDFILPLGGARMSNFNRPMMARRVMDEQKWSCKKIVALTGTRPINEIEAPYIEKYAPNAVTEFEAMSKGLEQSFELSGNCEEQFFYSDNINSQAIIRKYNENYRKSAIYSIAAPSSEPDRRRANSYDTFIYFVDNFKINEGDKLLLVTSSIYVPYQLLKFMDIAIELNIEVECIGSDFSNGAALVNASNYLQEIKGTIDTIYSLSKKYT